MVIGCQLSLNEIKVLKEEVQQHHLVLQGDTNLIRRMKVSISKGKENDGEQLEDQEKL